MTHASTIERYRDRSRIAAAAVVLSLFTASAAAGWTLAPVVAAIICTTE